MNKANEILEVLMHTINIHSANYDLDTNEGQYEFAQDIMETLRERDLLNE